MPWDLDEAKRAMFAATCGVIVVFLVVWGLWANTQPPFR